MERTFVAIKPDGVQRGLIGEVLTRFEHKGFQLISLKLMRVPKELAERHYAEHKEKPFFPELVGFFTSGPIIATVWQGDEIISSVRLMVGPTNSLKAPPGTIRGDYGGGTRKNIVHASDSPESADREINLFFKPEELLDWRLEVADWIR